MKCRWISGRPRHRSVVAEAGFTLLEAMVALLLLFAVVPMLAGFSSGLRSAGQVRDRMEAVTLADAKMSELAAMPLDSLNRYQEIREGVFDEPFGGYTWRALVRPTPESASVLRVAVLVAWDGREYTLETLLLHPGMEPDRWARRR